MWRRIPGWVLGGGVMLASVAGYVNAYGLLGARHEALSHVTGFTSRLAVETVAGGTEAPHLVVLILAFLVGAVVSGAIVRQATLRLGRRYAAALAVEGLLLTLAAARFGRGEPGGDLLAAAACGLQNALASTYSGAIVRTTHMTGILTDIGIQLGHWLRGDAPDRRRLLLHGALLVSFVAGGMAAAVAHHALGFAGLYAAAGVVFLSAFVYLLYLRASGGEGGGNPPAPAAVP